MVSVFEMNSIIVVIYVLVIFIDFPYDICIRKNGSMRKLGCCHSGYISIFSTVIAREDLILKQREYHSFAYSIPILFVFVRGCVHF